MSPLFKEAEGARAGQGNKIDRLLQASGGLQNRSKRYVTLLTGARTRSGSHTLCLPADRLYVRIH